MTENKDNPAAYAGTDHAVGATTGIGSTEITEERRPEMEAYDARRAADEWSRVYRNMYEA